MLSGGQGRLWFYNSGQDQLAGETSCQNRKEHWSFQPGVTQRLSSQAPATSGVTGGTLHALTPRGSHCCVSLTNPSSSLGDFALDVKFRAGQHFKIFPMIIPLGKWVLSEHALGRRAVLEPQGPTWEPARELTEPG